MKLVGYENRDNSITKRGLVTYIIDDDLPEDAPVLAILAGHGHTPEQIENIGKTCFGLVITQPVVVERMEGEK